FARASCARTIRFPTDGRDGGEVSGALGQPQMLEARPVPVVPLAVPDLAAASAAMLGRFPGIEHEQRLIVRTDAAVHREQRLVFGDGRHALDERVRAAAQLLTERAQIGRVVDDGGARRELFGRYHVRTPSRDQFSGNTVAPAARIAGAASRAGPFIMKNIDPPAPAPAALPPSVPAAAAACSRR